MDYVNLETGKRIDLADLASGEKKFYSQAQTMFRDNVNWLTFDEFAFGMRLSHLQWEKSLILTCWKSPLYLALKDMSSQLGVQQGKIARKAAAGQKASGGTVALA